MHELEFDGDHELFRCERCGEVFSELDLISVKRQQYLWSDQFGLWHANPYPEAFGHFPCGPIRPVLDIYEYVKAWEAKYGREDAD